MYLNLLTRGVQRRLFRDNWGERTPLCNITNFMFISPASKIFWSTSQKKVFQFFRTCHLRRIFKINKFSFLQYSLGLPTGAPIRLTFSTDGKLVNINNSVGGASSHTPERYVLIWLSWYFYHLRMTSEHTGCRPLCSTDTEVQNKNECMEPNFLKSIFRPGVLVTRRPYNYHSPRATDGKDFFSHSTILANTNTDK